MDKPSWLSLSEYSLKYGLSASTLRRKIKRNEIEYKFLNGKYVLKDAPVSRYQKPTVLLGEPVILENMDSNLQPTKVNEDAFLSTANQMIQELKSAYVTVLHEKELQIMQLKEEISNLKTLVKILETETDKKSLNETLTPVSLPWIDRSLE